MAEMHNNEEQMFRDATSAQVAATGKRGMEGFDDFMDEAVRGFLRSGAGDRPCVLLEEAPLRSDGGLCIDYLRLDREGGLTGLLVVRPGDGPQRMEETRWSVSSRP